MNKLAASDRTLVSDVPGTTRDLIEVPVVLNGLTVTLLDSAGAREAEGSVEAEGQERADEALDGADLVVLDRNIFTIPAPEIFATQVEMTLVDGEVVRDV